MMTAPPSSSEISATTPDWSREAIIPGEWAPGKQLLRMLRTYQRWAGRRGFFATVMRRFHAGRYRRWLLATGADIPPTTRIGGGLLLPHPSGVVIHLDAQIGPNCLIFQGVTIGTGSHAPGVPTIGGHVDVGAGAKILGPITIGDHAKIGANAVVLCDVPAGATAVGIPARIIPANGGAE
jgi:serine O-acetyltransferase